MCENLILHIAQPCDFSTGKINQLRRLSTQYLISALISLVAIRMPAPAASAHGAFMGKNATGKMARPVCLVQIAKPFCRLRISKLPSAPQCRGA
jgi:hypothetical protein